jgi:hypothetical protein
MACHSRLPNEAQDPEKKRPGAGQGNGKANPVRILLIRVAGDNPDNGREEACEVDQVEELEANEARQRPRNGEHYSHSIN